MKHANLSFATYHSIPAFDQDLPPPLVDRRNLVRIEANHNDNQNDGGKMINADDLRALQAPLKERYRDDPAAIVTRGPGGSPRRYQ